MTLSIMYFLYKTHFNVTAFETQCSHETVSFRLIDAMTPDLHGFLSLPVRHEKV